MYTWMRALARASRRRSSRLNMISHTRRHLSSNSSLPIFHTTFSPDLFFTERESESESESESERERASERVRLYIFR